MIKLVLNGEAVIDIIVDDLPPKDNEMVVSEIPHVDLNDNQKAYVYYRNGQIEYEIKRRD